MTDREIKLTADVAMLRNALTLLLRWNLPDEYYAHRNSGGDDAYKDACAALEATK